MAFSSIWSITIDHTQCGSADSTDFVILFSGIYDGTGGLPDLRVTGSGGNVTQSDGDDINFAANSDMSGLLDWEIEKYAPATGEIVAHIRISTLTFASDLVIYLGFGDSGVTTFQGDVNGTWSSDFEIVSHLNSSLADSTSHARTLTASGGSTNYVASKIDGGYKVTSPSSHYLTRSDGSLPAGLTPRSISIWANWHSNSYNGYFVFYGSASADQGQSFFHSWAGTPTLYYVGWTTNISVAFTPTLNQWYHLVATYDGTTAKLYIDGSLVASAVRVWSTVLGGTLYLSSSPFGQLELGFDEFRIVNVARDQSWITSEYNNQSNPSNFYSLASLAGGGSAIAPIVHHLRQQGIM